MAVLVNLEALGRLLVAPEAMSLRQQLVFDLSKSLQPMIWRADRPVVLITGGVHGYETSGVHGALQFVDQQATVYAFIFLFRDSLEIVVNERSEDRDILKKAA